MRRVTWTGGIAGTRPLLNQGSSVTLSLGIVIVSDQERPKRVASWNRRRSQGHFHSLLAKWYHFPRGWGSVGLQGPAAPAALSLYRARYQSSCESGGSICAGDEHRSATQKSSLIMELLPDAISSSTTWNEIQPTGIMARTICMEMGYLVSRTPST
ncbi:hypothetical protein K0M31_019092 [Melipona bicolor]|uniref:Uncharacterized protein n=1 Tax=Melipona bicolor TaxID=60889 RepID=A0AA40KQT0_9HYME|nr:hypothetical protein K0M31_019092 [Melipona bicolor]